MFYVTYGLSQCKQICCAFPLIHLAETTLLLANHPNYYLYSNLLSDGWIFNRKVDNSDVQYAQFRNHLPLLFALACGWLTLSNVYRRWKPSVQNQSSFYLISASIVIVALHGTSTIKILLITSTSFIIGRVFGATKWNPIMTWTFNLAILFLNEYYKGYKFNAIGLPMLVNTIGDLTEKLNLIYSL